MFELVKIAECALIVLVICAAAYYVIKNAVKDALREHEAESREFLRR